MTSLMFIGEQLFANVADKIANRFAILQNANSLCLHWVKARLLYESTTPLDAEWHWYAS